MCLNAGVSATRFVRPSERLFQVYYSWVCLWQVSAAHADPAGLRASWPWADTGDASLRSVGRDGNTVLSGHQGILDLGSQKSSGPLKLHFSLKGSLLDLLGITVLKGVYSIYLPFKFLLRYVRFLNFMPLLLFNIGA